MGKYLLFSISILICFSCSKNENHSGYKSIVSESQCGWCSETETLSMTSKETKFKSFKQCSLPDKNLEMDTYEPKWNEIVTAIDWNLFTSVKEGSSGILVDGCSRKLTICNEDDICHTVEYEYLESNNISSIQALVKKIEDYREELR